MLTIILLTYNNMFAFIFFLIELQTLNIFIYHLIKLTTNYCCQIFNLVITINIYTYTTKYKNVLYFQKDS